MGMQDGFLNFNARNTSLAPLSLPPCLVVLTLPTPFPHTHTQPTETRVRGVQRHPACLGVDVYSLKTYARQLVLAENVVAPGPSSILQYYTPKRQPAFEPEPCIPATTSTSAPTRSRGGRPRSRSWSWWSWRSSLCWL